MSMTTNDEELVQRVQKKLDENLERAKSMSSHLRNRGQVEVNSGDEFIHLFEEAKEELDKAIYFIHKLEKNPLLVFTESHIHLQSTKGASFLLLNRWNKKEHSIKGHNFQTYLAYYANLHLQEWLKEHQIEEPFHIAVRNPMQFPSIFALYHEDTELIQFDVINQWYGIRKRPLTEEELLKNHHNDINRIQKEIEEQEERIQKEIDRRDHPLKYYKGLKNILAYFMVGKRKNLSCIKSFG